MEVKVLSSKLVRPSYPAGAPRPDTTEHVPSSVFDKATYHMQMAIIYAFSPPGPSPADIERGLAAVLAVYRLFAGQLVPGPDDGAPGVLLNDHGARLVEATVDANLADIAPTKPSPAVLQLHPDLDGEIAELVQVQLTRFACGSLAVGFTANHAVADGHATSDFLVAWGRAARGLPIGHSPPFHHPEAHFTKDFVAGLRAKASEGRGRPFSRFETILAHVWRTITKARGLGNPFQTSTIRISVDGRPRLAAPQGYFGNLVLWGVVHRLRELGGRGEEGLEPTAVLKDVLCPDLEVDSWLTFPFYELDFGAGCPTYFMPSYFPTEGMLFIVPSYLGDGSVDVFVPLFEHNLEAFKQCCYSME
ncbi:hypothetical protein HU200_011104 [Digitaria exilis]|uniref:Uncharacterized protein n=1 Tax=Digitaria exilis TaxID=1010633 RepID=A0A835FI09_9POAL|nr:hypothetical protein HU200_011104 [Digitaria exilis]